MKYCWLALICCCFNLEGFAMSGPAHPAFSSVASCQPSHGSTSEKLGKRGLRKQLAKHKAPKKERKDRVWLLMALGLSSLLLAAWVLGFHLTSVIGFAFFTIATAIGYLISLKYQKERKNRFPKAMFLAAIVLNLLVYVGFCILPLLLPFD